MKHLGTKNLESKRLLLRRFEITDANAMFENWANDNDVTKYLTWPSHASAEVSETVLKEWLKNYENDDFYQWAIVLKSNGKEPIGSISIVHHRDNIEMVHVGYCIGKKWWGQGITAETLGELIRFFFNEVGANRIEARHDPNNPNSGKVMLKSGMRYEGTMRQADINNSGIGDCSMYGILAKDY